MADTMHPVLWLLAAIAAPWLAIGGLVLLALGTGVVEVVCIELAAVVLVLTGVGTLLADLAGYRS